MESVVYFCGMGEEGNAWYRVHLEGGESVQRKKINSVAGSATFRRKPEVTSGTFTLGGQDGSWTVTADYELYWVAGDSSPLGCTRSLFKHNSKYSYTRLWAVVSSDRILPRAMPFLAAVGRKLYLVAGTEDNHRNIDWSNGCGEIYDLDTKTFESMNIPDFHEHDTRHAALVVKDDGTDPTGIVFYSFLGGSMLFLDLTSSESHSSHGHYPLWNRTPLSPPPPGLEDSNVDMLDHVTRNIRAVFTNNTLYWFGYDMHLYGYDINHRIWLRSPSLTSKLGTMGSSHPSNCPVLVGLPNGKFLVIVSKVPGELTMASLAVVKGDQSLTVSVEYIQDYSLDDPSFVPSAGMALLKKTDPTLDRTVRSAMET